jgi:hypothetical protein
MSGTHKVRVRQFPDQELEVGDAERRDLEAQGLVVEVVEDGWADQEQESREVEGEEVEVTTGAPEVVALTEQPEKPLTEEEARAVSADEVAQGSAPDPDQLAGDPNEGTDEDQAEAPAPVEDDAPAARPERKARRRTADTEGSDTP